MKITLVFPRLTDNYDILGGSNWVVRSSIRAFGLGQTSFTPPLSLLMLAAVTPPGVEVKILDERLEDIDFDEETDLVGISVVTRAAPRAYLIASEYHKRGIKVVLGGIHPSALPKEALQHADALVIGEGESVWPELIGNFQQGELKTIYKGIPLLDLDLLPWPRREIIRSPELYASTKVVTATRGCPNSCTFCSAGVGLVKKYRKRSVKNIIAELESLPGKMVIFMDDNIGWDQAYTKELFSAMAPLGLHWMGAITASALEDSELVKLAAKSGCFMFGVGFESLSPQVIKSVRKQRTNHPECYASLIKRCQDAGIAVWGNFILGFDDDTLDTFSELIEFINRTRIELVSIFPLIPYPGSVLFRQYEKQNRILTKDWRFYDPADGACIYTPEQLTREQLLNGYLRVIEDIYAYRKALLRLLRSHSRFSFAMVVALHYYLQSKRSIPDQRLRVADSIKLSSNWDSTGQ
ncbi:MAG: hypothetical protein A2Z16_09080 [Chloroflexi bacterium RBG_16_54_18]|nr:MAG: hypothetical protein A2Z16_09080 [Chloroflexi bacterium RBG_16_54_18]